MRLRTQLILAFIVLAVVPLTAITLYSYRTSTRALRRTVEAESLRATREMEQRMKTVTASLGERFDLLEKMPLPEARRAMVARDQPPDPLLIGRMVAVLGDTADFIESFELVPIAGAPAPAAAPSAPGAVPEPPVPTEQLPFVFHLPRIVGELAKNPEVASIFESTKALILSGDPEKIQIEFKQELGRHAWEIAEIIKENVAARQEENLAAVEQVHERRRALEQHAVRQRQRMRERRMWYKQEYTYHLQDEGEPVCDIRVRVDSDRLLGEVMSLTKTEQGEIAFARDASGELFTPDPDDMEELRELAAVAGAGNGNDLAGTTPDEQWVVVTHDDPTSGLTFGIAHPVGESLDEIRRASARNLGAGLGLAALALFGILPISRRMTHNLSDLTRAAEQLAAGDLDTQVPVRSRDELGVLARTFNRMARELSANQKRLVAQERLRKELELCRRIQNELLPKRPLSFPFAEVQGISIPARELGGDFFNYFVLPKGEVALLMGDVSGKGVPAALTMANLHATLQARLPLERDLSVFAAKLDREVEASTPAEVYITLFLSVLDPARRELRFVNAGHESPFLLRSDGRVERLEPTGRPIGLMAGGKYTERSVPLEAGDHLLLYTDGLVEAENAAGSEFGAARLEALLRGASGADSKTLLARIERAFLDHRGEVDAADDATLLMLKVGYWVGRGGKKA